MIRLLLELLRVQVILPALLADQGSYFVPQQSKPRIAVHVAFPEPQLARPDGRNDFLLSQTELLPGGLVAERGSLPCPY